MVQLFFSDPTNRLGDGFGRDQYGSRLPRFCCCSQHALYSAAPDSCRMVYCAVWLGIISSIFDFLLPVLINSSKISGLGNFASLLSHSRKLPCLCAAQYLSCQAYRSSCEWVEFGYFVFAARIKRCTFFYRKAPLALMICTL